jgi:hypothetical protein
MKNKKLLLLFSISLIVRLLYCFAMPFFKIKLDEQRYDILSNQILNGNYDLDAISFICAPFMPFFIAFIKSFSTNYWQEITFVLQAILTSISVIYLFKLTDLLFKNKQISTIAAWFYTFYPMTFYYVKNVGQESFYQSFLIISVYFLIKFSTLKATKDLIISAILFSFCFLTKGIILFWSPFIVFFIFGIKDLNFKRKIYNSLIFSILCLIFTLPFGLNNWQRHKIYTFSGDGLSTYFWFGNSEYAYHRDVLGTTYEVNKTAEIQDTAKLIYDMSPPNVSMETYQKALQLFPSEQARQAIFRRNAWAWIQDNPKRFFELKIHCFVRYIMCGLNFKIYPLPIWLISLVIFAPLYFLAYWGVYMSVKNDFNKHNWMLGLFLSMLLFSIVFSFESRFRTITLEPFYIIYAAFSAHYFTQRYREHRV